MVTPGRDVLVIVRPFMAHHFHSGQDFILRNEPRHMRWMPPLTVLAWKDSKSYCAPPQVTSEEKGKSNKSLGGIELNQCGMLSGLPLVHLHLTSVVEPEGMSKAPALVRDRLSP